MLAGLKMSNWRHWEDLRKWDIMQPWVNHHSTNGKRKQKVNICSNFLNIYWFEFTALRPCVTRFSLSKQILSKCEKVRKERVVVEWLAYLPVTQNIGVRFYLERESSATSSWINVGREWCCRGWDIEGGMSDGLFRTRDGFPRIRKVRAAHNVHECESVCDWNQKHCICAEMVALYECLYMCCISLYMYMYVFKLMCVFHCTALRALMM